MSGKRIPTLDREAPASKRSEYFTVEQISANQALTNEGFLLCRDVPAARTGQMIYGPMDGLPIPLGRDGLIRIERDADEVFRDTYLASFNGKPLCDDHPPEVVTPDNWSNYAVGTVLNPRRGSGIHDDCVVVDLLVTSKDAIEAVRSGKREVSVGYDADYEETEPGFGKQTNMRVNHVALVDQGRCGPRCAIRDHQQRPNDMSAKPSWIDKLKAAFVLKDQKVFDEALAEAPTMADEGAEAAPSGGIHVHLHGGMPTEAPAAGLNEKPDATPAAAEGSGQPKVFDNEEVGQRIAALEASHGQLRDMCDMVMSHLGLKKAGESDAESNETESEAPSGTENKEIEGEYKEEAPPGTTDAVLTATKDSRLLIDSLQQTIADAEVIAPGLKIPTVDHTAPKRTTFDAICAHRRAALAAYYKTADGRETLNRLRGGQYVADGMTCAAVRQVFRSAVQVARVLNNAKVTKDIRHGNSAAGPMSSVDRIKEMNKRNAEFWAKQG